MSVSGPYNVVRLEGTFNNVKKVIYLYFDVHETADYQTECKHIKDKTIKEHLIENFEKKHEYQIDFFMEDFPDSTKHDSDFVSNYINQVRKIISQSFEFNYKSNEVLKSKEFPNVRFHYIDIRPYLTFTFGTPFTIANDLSREIYNVKNILINLNNLHIIGNITNDLKFALNTLYTAFYKDIQIKKVRIINESKNKDSRNYNVPDQLFYLVDKIKNKYNNKECKRIIGDIINKDLLDLFNKIYDQIAKLETVIDESKNLVNHKFEDKVNYKDTVSWYGFVQSWISHDIFNKLYSCSGDINENTSTLYAYIMDLYFLRRFMDKDYVTNSVVYTGGLHSMNYVKLLCSHFDFKLTHAAYISVPIEQFNQKVKSLTSVEIDDMLLPEKLFQCSDLSNFPLNFS